MTDQEKSSEKLNWKCSNCGYTLENREPPNQCPSCGEKCEFINVTCYIPDCGGPGSGNMDPRLK